jgi:hypothetical protein
MPFPIGGQLIRSYKGDSAIVAGVAVIAGSDGDHVALPGGANVRALGISSAAIDAAEKSVAVVEVGEVKAIADAAINRGDLVMVNANTGQLAPIGAVAGTNYHTVGIALEAAAAQGDEFLLLVLPSRSQG